MCIYYVVVVVVYRVRIDFAHTHVYHLFVSGLLKYYMLIIYNTCVCVFVCVLLIVLRISLIHYNHVVCVYNCNNLFSRNNIA